jgi:hypothetical protein
MTSKQHNRCRFQIGASLECAPAFDNILCAYTCPVPFLARPPAQKEVEIEIISDLRPGDRVVLVGEALKNSFRAANHCITCDLRRCSDGAEWKLQNEQGKRSNGAGIITRLPRDVTCGNYELRVCGLDIEYAHESKVFSVVIGERPSMSSNPHVVPSECPSVPPLTVPPRLPFPATEDINEVVPSRQPSELSLIGFNDFKIPSVPGTPLPMFSPSVWSVPPSMICVEPSPWAAITGLVTPSFSCHGSSDQENWPDMAGLGIDRYGYGSHMEIV